MATTYLWRINQSLIFENFLDSVVLVVSQARKICIAVGLVLIGFAGSANADLIAFTDETEFDNAVAGLAISTEDFESSPTGNLPTGLTDIGLFDINVSNQNNFTFIGNAFLFSGRFPTTVFNLDLYEGGGINGADSATLTNFDVTEAVFGLGFDVGISSPNTSHEVTATANGSSVTFNVNSRFIGIVDDTTPITSLTLTAPNEFLVIDDVKFASIPEPSTIVPFFVIGLACLGCTATNRRSWPCAASKSLPLPSTLKINGNRI